MASRFRILLVGFVFTLRPSEAILCYNCSDENVFCSVTSDNTPVEQCTGFCQTRVVWKFRDTVRYVNISRSCVSTCYDRTYLYGYFDSVEDICCGDDLCNRHTKPSRYNKCHYCTGDGVSSCLKNDYVTKSTDDDALIFCVGECKKVISVGSYDGTKITSVERSCDEQCTAGDRDLLDPYGDKKIGTKTTYCCSGDLCNTAGIQSGSMVTWYSMAAIMALGVRGC